MVSLYHCIVNCLLLLIASHLVLIALVTIKTPIFLLIVAKNEMCMDKKALFDI